MHTDAVYLSEIQHAKSAGSTLAKCLADTSEVTIETQPQRLGFADECASDGVFEVKKRGRQ